MVKTIKEEQLGSLNLPLKPNTIKWVDMKAHLVNIPSPSAL